MPRVEMQRRFENTMTWSVMIEPGQTVDLFNLPACEQLRIPEEVGLELKHEGPYPSYLFMRNCGWYAMVGGIALSRRDVVLSIESSHDRHQIDLSGPWVQNGKTLAAPVLVRAGDRFKAKVRALPSAPVGPVDVQIAWVLTTHTERVLKAMLSGDGSDPFQR